MRESRLSGSVEGVMSDHDSYSDFTAVLPCARRVQLAWRVLKYGWVIARYRTCTYVFEISGLAEACEPVGSDGDRRRSRTFHCAIDEKAAILAYGIGAGGYLGSAFPGWNTSLK